ncbi:hypothetical protein BH23GEM10_BH23GEM10_04080 [soil metagenome]
MSGKQFSVTGVVVTIATAVLVLSGVVVLEALYYGLAAGGVDATSAAAVRTVVISALLALAVIGVGLAVVAGRALSRALGDLRAGVLARARGDMQRPLPVSGIAQLTGLASAVDRLSARDAAREAEARRESVELAVLLDAISEGILRIDAGGRLLRSNPAARLLLGLGESALGQPIATSIRQAELRSILGRAARGDFVEAAELTVDERRLIVSARPIGTDTDARGGAVVAFVDLTEVRRLEGVRRDFVANVSHELKTPLTSIRGYVETLLADDELPLEERRQFLDVVRKNAGRLHHIVDDLLDLSRLESGGWRPELHEVDALAIVRDVWSGCTARAEKRRVTFVPPDEAYSVLADAGGLRQVLSNLFDNALRHTPDGGCIRVTMRCVPAMQRFGSNGDAGAAVLFEIRDSGAGIPSEALPRIFERFYRADPARSRAEGGTGLGLAIVKHLIERMGGDVTADSEFGKGTVIRFRLPAAQ